MLGVARTVCLGVASAGTGFTVKKILGGLVPVTTKFSEKALYSIGTGAVGMLVVSKTIDHVGYEFDKVVEYFKEVDMTNETEKGEEEK